MDPNPNVASAYWEAVSAMDADDVAARFTPQAWFQFGNTPPLRGRTAIRRAFVELFAKTASIGCRPVAEWGGETYAVTEADLWIVFDDGTSLTIPITMVLLSDGQGIQDCRIQFYPEPALERRGIAGPPYGLSPAA